MSEIVICGGNGAQGREALALLTKALPNTRFHVIDRVQVDGSDRIQSTALDLAEDHQLLRRKIHGARLVLNFAGPFYRLGPRVLRACIESKVDYLDICDDIDATRELLACSKEAEAAGVRGLVGVGSAPGTTNLLVKLALDYLEVKPGAGYADISWCAPGSDLTLGIFEHLVHCFRTALLGRTRTPDWEELEPRIVKFPDPIGSLEVVRLGHPEPLTLPMFLDCQCMLRGGMTTPGLMRMAWELARKCDDGLDLVSAWKQLQGGIPQEHGREQSGMVIDVTCAGRGIRFESATGISMEQSTAVPAVAGALLLLGANGPMPGVWPPEVLSPQDFFSAAAKVSPGGGGLRAFGMVDGQRDAPIRLRDMFTRAA